MFPLIVHDKTLNKTEYLDIKQKLLQPAQNL